MSSDCHLNHEHQGTSHVRLPLGVSADIHVCVVAENARTRSVCWVRCADLVLRWQGQVMTERVARLGLCIETGSEADAEELAELAVHLREQLLKLDIERADPATMGQAPPGTRAGEIWVAGALTVMLAQSSGLFTALIETVQSWVSLIGGRSVKLEIDGDVLEVNGITREDQRELIHAWIDRHTDQ
jgi:hypothetical protein